MSIPLKSRYFRQGETLRWPCRAGDHVLWMRMSSPFAADGKWNIRDFWATREGDTVTLTNQWDDLPPWFELHPLEVADSLCARMGAMLAAGWVPEEPTDGPGLWRVGAGDRVVRVGVDREGAIGHDGVLAIVSFERSALAFGEGSGPAQALIFGAVGASVPREQKARFKAGYLAAAAEGAARCIDDAWRLG
jgi:hypothetical protein